MTKDEFGELPKKVQKHFTAALGWLNLGNWREAKGELDAVPAEYREQRLTAGLYLEILSAGKQWREKQLRATLMAEKFPDDVQWLISQAYATRRAESLPQARMILRAAYERFPQAALVSYNLACYAAQLGELAEAKSYLTEAVKLDAAYGDLALQDEDLEPIREFILDIR
jgi:tetratricopeptide (TPR) repeat protein